MKIYFDIMLSSLFRFPNWCLVFIFSPLKCSKGQSSAFSIHMPLPSHSCYVINMKFLHFLSDITQRFGRRKGLRTEYGIKPTQLRLVLTQENLQNGGHKDTWYSFLRPDLNVYCDRLVIFMFEGNKHDLSTIYSTMLYMKSEEMLVKIKILIISDVRTEGELCCMY